jgi:hypothetical protein
MEGHQLVKYLSEMLRRYPKMATQFARPDMQHDSLYDAIRHGTITKVFYMQSTLSTPLGNPADNMLSIDMNQGNG